MGEECQRLEHLMGGSISYIYNLTLTASINDTEIPYPLYGLDADPPIKGLTWGSAHCLFQTTRIKLDVSELTATASYQ